MKRQETQMDKHEAVHCEANSDLHKQIMQQEAHFRAKGRLMNIMAYQIRTLSNAIVGFSDLLLSEPLNLDQTDYVREINQAGAGLSSLVNEVLDWNHLMSGRLVITRIRCELGPLAKRLEGILASAAGEKGLDYRVWVDPNLPKTILCDSDHLFKCLLNLLSNAVKYTLKGSVEIHMRLENTPEQPAVCFDIIDTGVGIEPERIDRIFDPDQTSEESGQELAAVFGLDLTVTVGLSLTRQLCRLMGGTIEVASRPGAGSTFTLRIPAHPQPAAETAWSIPADIPCQSSGPATPMSYPSAAILLAEDQPSNRTVISLMLEALGARVDTAQDGGEAVQKAAQNAYDLILMDLKMPKMDGYEAARRIRQFNKQTPIVALSAQVFSETEHQQVESLFDELLTKPVDSRKLAELMNKFVTCDIQKASKPAAGRIMQNDSDEIAIRLEYGG